MKGRNGRQLAATGHKLSPGVHNKPSSCACTIRINTQRVAPCQETKVITKWRDCAWCEVRTMLRLSLWRRMRASPHWARPGIACPPRRTTLIQCGDGHDAPEVDENVAASRFGRHFEAPPMNGERLIGLIIEAVPGRRIFESGMTMRSNPESSN